MSKANEKAEFAPLTEELFGTLNLGDRVESRWLDGEPEEVTLTAKYEHLRGGEHVYEIWGRRDDGGCHIWHKSTNGSDGLIRKL